MAEPYPHVEPNEHGLLDMGDGQHVYWEVCGNPDGKPALALHGGPGSGCTASWRRYFDPARYRIVLFDQRGCGRSTPHASAPDVDLRSNTTAHLIADIERLRTWLGIDRWLLLGGSWGSTLALAYAEDHPERVSEIVLYSVVTTSRREVEWITRDVGRLFPGAWARFREGVPDEDRDGPLSEAYARLLESGDPDVRKRAAAAWCEWEQAHLAGARGEREDLRFTDASFRMSFARLVTHYWRHAGFLEDGALLRHLVRLAEIPAVMVHGGLDLSSPLDVPTQISQEWARSALIVIDAAGHSLLHRGMAEAVVAATDRFASRE